MTSYKDGTSLTDASTKQVKQEQDKKTKPGQDAEVRNIEEVYLLFI